MLELERSAQELLKVYLLNFVKLDIVNESDVTTINYTSLSNCNLDEKLSIGKQASSTSKQLLMNMSLLLLLGFSKV